MAIAWVLRDQRVTSALIGARNVEQLDDSLDALKKLEFTAAELKEIDRHAQDGGIDLWRRRAREDELDAASAHCLAAEASSRRRIERPRGARP